MKEITTRTPLIEWHQGFDRHWYGGNPAVTHAFKALSFLLPQAESFFIEVTRRLAYALPAVRYFSPRFHPRNQDNKSELLARLYTNKTRLLQLGQYNGWLEPVSQNGQTTR